MRKGLLTLTLAAVGVGCAGPEVTVRHLLPPDLPVPGQAGLVVGTFEAVGGEKDGYADFAAAELSRRIRAAGRGPGRAGGDTPKLTISAKLYVKTAESKGTRTIRRLNPQRKPPKVETLDVPTLTRTAAVRADFLIRDEAGRRKIAAAETRESYDSTEDPRVRGPLALDRPDAPKYVPPAETIVRELLAACVETFWQMIRPREVTAKVTLRPASGSAGQKGLAAAAEGKFADALRHFAAAAEGDPKNTDLLFNLAVCAEGAGRLEEARRRYEAVVRRGGKGYPQAGEALRRVRRVLSRRK